MMGSVLVLYYMELHGVFIIINGEARGRQLASEVWCRATRFFGPVEGWTRGRGGIDGLGC